MVRVPMILVIRVKDFVPLGSVVSTVYLRWTAIMIQIVRMDKVGMMKASGAAIQTQVSLTVKNLTTLGWWWWRHHQNSLDSYYQHLHFYKEKNNRGLIHLMCVPSCCTHLGPTGAQLE